MTEQIAKRVVEIYNEIDAINFNIRMVEIDWQHIVDRASRFKDYFTKEVEELVIGKPIKALNEKRESLLKELAEL